jgi:hypothetical protein
VPLFSRRPALPADVRRRLALPDGDRVLASAALTDGRWVVATRRALHVAAESADGPVVRSPWSDVDRASFSPETTTITVHWVTGATEELALTPPVPVSFAQTLRERVQSSVVHVETVTVPHGGTVRVALRRGEDDELFTQVMGTGQVDLDDPGVVRLLEQAEAQVLAAAGLRA